MNSADKSQVARLYNEIDQAVEAARLGLDGLAVSASHEIITARMEIIAQRFTAQAKQLLGESPSCQS